MRTIGRKEDLLECKANEGWDHVCGPAEYGWPDDDHPSVCRACFGKCHSPGNFVHMGVNGEHWDAKAFRENGDGRIPEDAVSPSYRDYLSELYE